MGTVISRSLVSSVHLKWDLCDEPPCRRVLRERLKAAHPNDARLIDTTLGVRPTRSGPWSRSRPSDRPCAGFPGEARPGHSSTR